MQALEMEAPELAELARRLQSLAQEENRSGDRGLASHLSSLAQLVVASGSEMALRVDTLELEVTRLMASKKAEPAPAPSADGKPAEAPPRKKPVGSSGKSSATKRGTASNDGDAPKPGTDANVVRERLAAVARELATLKVRPEQKVTVESIQGMLIKGDRQLSQGQLDQAAQTADEAERLLQSLANDRSSSVPRTGSRRATANR